MPAKAKSKKSIDKPAVPVAKPEAAQTPAPPTGTGIPTSDIPDTSAASDTADTTGQDLERMLESDGDESALEQRNTILFGAGVVITGGIIVATIAIFVLYLNAPKAKKEEADTTVLTMTPTPTTKPVVVTIEVRNGSGVAGAAATGAQKLSDKGYEVVGTGNAKKQATTQVFISTALPQMAVTALLADLSTLFGISSSSGVLGDVQEGMEAAVRSTASALLVLGTK